jgi:hypothetical protein
LGFFDEFRGEVAGRGKETKSAQVFSLVILLSLYWSEKGNQLFW